MSADAPQPDDGGWLPAGNLKFDADLHKMMRDRLGYTAAARKAHEEKRAGQAEGFQDRLRALIENFEADLDEAHEVGVRLVTFGQAVTFHLESIGYFNPSLITFSGRTADGSPVELIQHVSQISVLLQKVKRLNPTEPKQPIGFHAIRDPATGGE